MTVQCSVLCYVTLQTQALPTGEKGHTCGAIIKSNHKEVFGATLSLQPFSTSNIKHPPGTTRQPETLETGDAVSPLVGRELSSNVYMMSHEKPL